MIDAKRLLESWLFAELNPVSRRQALVDVYERIFEQNQVVMLAHEPCKAVYFVAEGVVRAYLSSLEGREYVFDYFVPGDFFNIEAAIVDQTVRFTADVLTNVTLYAIPCDRFMIWMHEYPQLAQAVSDHLAHEVCRLSDMVEGLALHTVRTRLARFLLARADDKLPHKIWTQGDIAAHIGTVRDVVGRTLREFGREGLVRRERGRLVVTNRNALESEAMRFAI
ncbi:MAG: Crp/Fnr family transcriptional regulator [Anaerolineae bacterium]|nr:Crp/Fnr family transcriptional regulator [Anaerolineae bacterium]